LLSFNDHPDPGGTKAGADNETNDRVKGPDIPRDKREGDKD
jgi:hypothetical protein